MKPLLTLIFLCTTLLAAERKPNVIVFLVDDMGWMDCGAYGSKYYETPNIDRFAARASSAVQVRMRVSSVFMEKSEFRKTARLTPSA